MSVGDLDGLMGHLMVGRKAVHLVALKADEKVALLVAQMADEKVFQMVEKLVALMES